MRSEAMLANASVSAFVGLGYKPGGRRIRRHLDRLTLRHEASGRQSQIADEFAGISID